MNYNLLTDFRNTLVAPPSISPFNRFHKVVIWFRFNLGSILCIPQSHLPNPHPPIPSISIKSKEESNIVPKITLFFLVGKVKLSKFVSALACSNPMADKLTGSWVLGNFWLASVDLLLAQMLAGAK